MGGKGAGKKRNRAAQSEQHGYQQPPGEKAVGTRKSEAANHSERERQKVLARVRELEKKRRAAAAPEAEGEEVSDDQPER